VNFAPFCFGAGCSGKVVRATFFSGVASNTSQTAANGRLMATPEGAVGSTSLGYDIQNEGCTNYKGLERVGLSRVVISLFGLVLERLPVVPVPEAQLQPWLSSRNEANA